VGFLTRVDPVEDLWRTADRVDYPIPGSDCGFRGSGSSGVSKHYFARFRLPAGQRTIDLIIAGLHLIAFPLVADRCAQREAQTAVIQKVLKDHTGETIILGDFNDYDDSILDTAGDIPISKALAILKNEHVVPQNAGSQAQILFNVATIHSSRRQDLYSAWYDINKNCRDEGGKEHTMIDHILVSPLLRSRISSMWFDHSFEASCTSFASDHWPVAVEISF